MEIYIHDTLTHQFMEIYIHDTPTHQFMEIYIHDTLTHQFNHMESILKSSHFFWFKMLYCFNVPKFKLIHVV